MIEPITFTASVVLAAAVGAGAHALIRQREDRARAAEQAASDEWRANNLAQRRRNLDDRIKAVSAEIARRKKRRKAGEPVSALRRELTALTHKKLRIDAAEREAG